MYVIVIGLGQVGRHVVRMLEWEGHDVVAVDNNAAAITWVEEHHDVMTMQGYGASQAVLQRAKAATADLVCAVTDHDEVNLIAALAARQLGAKRVIARVEGREWSGTGDRDGVEYGMLGVDVVFNPKLLLAREIAKISQSHGATEVIDLADERIEIVAVELDTASRMLKKPLSKIPFPEGVLVAAVVRDHELFVPGGADVLLAHDRVYIVGLPSRMVEAEDLFSRTREARRVCIVGGGVIGEALAMQLLEAEAEVMIIERDLEVAKNLGARLPGVTVVHGDGTDMGLLTEENVGSYDLFVAASHEDEVNLMAGLLAQRVGTPRTVTVVHRPDYMDIYKQLGIDIVLSPRIVASDHILRFCRQKELKAIATIENGRAEVMELRALEGARAVGVPVKRMGMPRGTLLCAILKRDRVIIPSGEDTIEAGDTVIALATAASHSRLLRLFQKRAF